MMDQRAIPRPTQVASRWVRGRTFTGDVAHARVLESRKRAEGVRVSVGIPTRNQAATIGDACSAIRTELMATIPLVDELVVLDSGSIDGTDICARAAGARVVHVGALLPEVPKASGRGDTLWKSLTALSGDIVVWLDADTRDFDAFYVSRLIEPLLMHPTISFVKGFHERPLEIDLEIDGVRYLAGGERMTEILARPILNIFFPELGGFFQPLATSHAGRMTALRQIPFFSGDSVDVTMLIDLLDIVGLDGMAQAALGPRADSNVPLELLGPKAHAITRAILTRAQERKRIRLAPNALAYPLAVPRGGTVDPVRIDEIERPPIEVIPSYLAALRETSRTSGPLLGRNALQSLRADAIARTGFSFTDHDLRSQGRSDVSAPRRPSK